MSLETITQSIRNKMGADSGLDATLKFDCGSDGVIVLDGASTPNSVSNTASSMQWLLIALTGFVTTVPLLLFAASSQRIPLTLIGPMQYIVPTINFLLGWLLYAEEITTTKVAGFALIWVCLAIVLLDLFIWQRRAVQSQPQSA